MHGNSKWYTSCCPHMDTCAQKGFMASSRRHADLTSLVGEENHGENRGNHRSRTLKFDGNKLRERRLEVGRSLDEACMACSIAVEILKAFEEGDLDRLPPRPFALGFLRSYCQYLDLAPEGFLAELEEVLYSIRRQNSATKAEKVRASLYFRLPSLHIHLSKELKTWLAVCGLLLLGWFAYSTMLTLDSDPAQGRAQAAGVDLAPEHVQEDPR